MINDALSLIATSINAAVGWFGAITYAIPGSQQLIIASFFLVCSFTIILRPLYKGGASDLARRKESQQRTEAYRQARLNQSRRGR